ncbi:hypothetical protein V2A84_09540 [Yersinia sp. 2553 StPb PI]|uniref:hypothetical protein n=1 Tax=Yersinia sp. 2553 StPb PI TaxID=3117411 RepID=UPI003FA42BDE
MKALDSFTVERLEEITELKALSFPPSHHELAALARIALAAKRAEPVINIKFKDGWPVPESVGVVDSGQKLADGYHDFYTTPQLNSPEIPEGWKLVPNVVTTEMTDAARIIDGRLSAEKYHRIYRLMQAAAPDGNNKR